MSTAPTTPLITVVHANQCIGFLLRRGKQGIEVYTCADESLGCFPSEREAVAALLNPPRDAQS
jgi:hypothetical protein